jgi:hypothetical protein
MRNASTRVFVSALLAASALSAAPARAEPPAVAAPCGGAEEAHQKNVDRNKKEIALIEKIIDELNAKAIKESQQTSALDDSIPADHQKLFASRVRVFVIRDKINKLEEEMVTYKTALSGEQAALTASEGDCPPMMLQGWGFPHWGGGVGGR